MLNFLLDKYEDCTTHLLICIQYNTGEVSVL